jgi:3',5'-cyclic-AMP phosphodiesterase
MPTRPLKIALITDIHHGPDIGSKKGTAAKRLFNKFQRWLSSSQADMVVDLGDRITDEDAALDRKRLSEVAQWFKKIRLPRHHLVGNHDIDCLSVSENEALLGQPLCSRAVIINGWRLIFWAVNSKLAGKRGLIAKPEELSWLRTELKRRKIPTIIFTHAPLGNGSYTGNFYFEKAVPHLAGYSPEQGEKIREIIERSETVVMCINGHAHWNAYQCIDGIHYVTLPALTDIFPTHPQPTAAWSMLELKRGGARLEVFGNLPIAYELTYKQLNKHWVNIHKSYAPKGIRPR